MARMYPSYGPKTNDSRIAEPLVYQLLQEQLDDSFHVIHSIPWLSSFVMEYHQSHSPIGEIDFLVLHESLGILAIEVKGGRLKHGIQGFYYSKTSVHTVSEIDPVSQLNRGIFAIQKWLSEQNIKVKIGRAYYFPESETTPNSLPPAFTDPTYNNYKVNLTLDIRDHSSVQKRIIEIMSYHKYHLKAQNLGPDVVKALIEKIVPTADYSPCWLSRISHDNYLWLRLTDEQNEAVSRAVTSTRFLVNGWPGSGKTLVAIQAARVLCDEGQKVLVVTFNTLLSKKIAEELEDYSTCQVNNVHSLCREAHKFLGKETEIRNQDWVNIGAYQDLLEATELGYLKGFDCLIVDEGQVICDVAWRALVSAFENKKIVVMCDAFQAFDYEKRISLSDLSIITNTEPYTLTTSLRIPKLVCERLKLFNQPTYSVVNPRSRENDTLAELVVSEPNTALKQIVDELISDGIPHRYITVLTPFSMAVPNGLVPQGISVENIGKYRGLEKPIVIVLSHPRMTDVDFFCSYSRATSKCISILDAVEVQRGAYASLGVNLYENKKHVIDQQAQCSFSSKIIEDANLSYCQVTKNIPIYWCESWACYVLKDSENESFRLLLECYLSTTETQQVLSWGQHDIRTVSLINGAASELYAPIENGYLELVNCPSCNMLSPQKIHGFGEKKCYKCESNNSRDYDFERRVSQATDVIIHHDKYTREQLLELEPALLSTFLFCKYKGSWDNKALLTALSAAGKNANRISVMFLAVYVWMQHSRGNDRISIGDASKVTFNWNNQIKNKGYQSWQGYINHAVKILEDSLFLEKLGKGQRRILSKSLSINRLS